MTNSERAAQLWPLLMLAARTQMILSYKMIEQMTGIDKRGLGSPLGCIYWYCERNQLPRLTSLVINQEEGKPTPELFDGVDIQAAQARVFVYDWFSRRAPTAAELQEAYESARGKPARAV